MTGYDSSGFSVVAASAVTLYSVYPIYTVGYNVMYINVTRCILAAAAATGHEVIAPRHRRHSTLCRNTSGWAEKLKRTCLRL